jgi:hypothetical protein
MFSMLTLGALGVLTVAAFLEAWGDSFFQAGFYRSSGLTRVLMLLAGAVLAPYGSTVNLPAGNLIVTAGLVMAFSKA